MPSDGPPWRAAVAALVSSTTPALADTGPGGPSYHLRAWSLGAEAAWTTLPADGAVVAGVVYVDTHIFLTEQGGKDDGTVFRDGVFLFDQYRYMFDRRGPTETCRSSPECWRQRSRLSIEHRLTSAFVTATVQFTTCGMTGSGMDRLRLWRGPIIASWSGQGDVVRDADNSVLATRHSPATRVRSRRATPP
jgi:hypothetical protein